ncbi:DNA polymerase/3'-5' exonuclease PolX [Salinicoccus halodurans]|uniref:DNA polymerase n=1 Tax=Salinicoccus halodurans TaxID=407035 RepID=A0A0F7HMB1_9STAP|nr:DNA polymerase/3'-5' exonuclease PolX [Salinicoccus halodurans]AKG74217.1 DNA polymerase [Salinicoccus halodurans]SFK93165.1 DNA polymerase (family 10) [Salinicoccus halodurans]
MTKKDIIVLLETIATYMELSLENPFKVSAYRKAAASIETDGRSLSEIDDFSTMKGIGKGVNEVIVEYVDTGRSTVLDELKESVPEGLVRMLKIPMLGPKKIAKIHKELGIASMEGLKEACDSKRVSTLPGFGVKTEQNISKAIDELLTRPERYPIERIISFRTAVENVLDEMEMVEKYDVAGSGRRFKETSRDLDYIIEVTDAAAFTESFLESPFVRETVAKGEKKLSVVIEDDMDEINVDFRFVTSREYFTTLHHFTGSKDHNVKMRQIAKSRGEKISEYGVESNGEIKTFGSEESFFNHFGLPFIPPTMRESGEETDTDISKIVSMDDMKGDLHMHTVYSDGAFSVREMVEACIAKGYKYMIITDHSKSLRVANGLYENRLYKQIEEIKGLRDEYPEIDIYTGTEMDILKDGTLDYSDDMLKELDYVLAAIHSSFTQTEAEIMHRLKSACENPYVRHIAHPTGRLIGSRAGYPVNMQELISMAKDTGTVLEVNANPRRLDLSADVIRHSGLKLTVNTDAHHTAHLDFMEYGVATLQKALIQKEDVINTFSREDFRNFVNKGK